MLRFIAVAAVLLFPSLSYGCECMALLPDNEQVLLDEAVYYGYFDVLDVQMPDWSGDAPRTLKATLKPAKQYGETPPDVLQITSDLYTNCGKTIQKDKQEHLLIFKNDDGYYLEGICSDLSEKTWASFEKDVLDYHAYYDFAATLDHKKHVLSLDKFRGMAQSENVVILDLRSKQAYDAGHMKGAIHVGSDITQDILAQVIPSKETTVLTYCTNSLFLTRMIALTDIVVPQIYALGYHNVYSLQSAAMDNDLDDKNRRDKLNFIYPAE